MARARKPELNAFENTGFMNDGVLGEMEMFSFGLSKLDVVMLYIPRWWIIVSNVNPMLSGGYRKFSLCRKPKFQLCSRCIFETDLVWWALECLQQIIRGAYDDRWAFCIYQLLACSFSDRTHLPHWTRSPRTQVLPRVHMRWQSNQLAWVPMLVWGRVALHIAQYLGRYFDWRKTFLRMYL